MRGTARYIEHLLNYNNTLLVWDSSFEEFTCDTLIFTYVTSGIRVT